MIMETQLRDGDTAQWWRHSSVVVYQHSIQEALGSFPNTRKKNSTLRINMTRVLKLMKAVESTNIHL